MAAQIGIQRISKINRMRKGSVQGDFKLRFNRIADFFFMSTCSLLLTGKIKLLSKS